LAKELTPDELASCCFALVAVMQDERLAPGSVPLPPPETPGGWPLPQKGGVTQDD